jgi:hypothetical protein
MRLVKYILLSLLGLLIGLYVFMPKSALYYKAEEFLKSKNIVIGNEQIESNLLHFRVNNAVIYYQGADLARIEQATIKPYLLVNSATIKNIETLGIAKKLGNISVESLKIKHSAFKPLYLKLYAVGSFGKADGYVDLKSHLVHIDIREPKDIKALQQLLKKGEEGWYYESKY